MEIGCSKDIEQLTYEHRLTISPLLTIPYHCHTNITLQMSSKDLNVHDVCRQQQLFPLFGQLAAELH